MISKSFVLRLGDLHDSDTTLTNKQNTEWVDLTHDTDVNHLENTPRLTREEREDIEVLFNNNYVPLTEIQHAKMTPNSNVQKNIIEESDNENYIERFKRNIPQNTTERPSELFEIRLNTEGVMDAVNRKPRDVTIPEMDFTSVRSDGRMVNIDGLRIEDSDKEPKIIEDGVPSVLADSRVTLR